MLLALGITKPVICRVILQIIQLNCNLASRLTYIFVITKF